MSAPPISLLVAGAARAGTQPERAGAKLDRVWLASLEQALQTDASLAAGERRSRKATLACPHVSLQPVQTLVKQWLPFEAGRKDAAGVRRVVAGVVNAASGGEPREPLRWHAEWAEAGVRVWLGSDGSGGDAALDARVAAIVGELRRELDVRGLRLLTVTCNGREVWAAETGNKANRSRSASMEGQ